jgi:hypothetical protein
MERWQLDDGAPEGPALAEPAQVAALPRDPRVVPRLFGAPDGESDGPEGEDAPF